MQKSEHNQQPALRELESRSDDISENPYALKSETEHISHQLISGILSE
jgi:hypothetical protein